MEEWISLNEFMRRNHIGYEAAIRLINSGKIEYQKEGQSQYKIKAYKNVNTSKEMELLIRENEELKTMIKTMQRILGQVQV